ESSAGLWLAFALAVAVVLLVLSALFDSFLDPIIIFLALPLALAGGVGALWLAGMTLNIYSQIGLLLLVGLLAKNAILVVDFANQRRREGLDVREAIEEAARTRFRPVLMTSFSTGFGALPLALATGPGAEGRAVLGVVIIGGIILATLVTLLIVPVLYRLLAPFTPPPGAVEEKVEEQLG
ncbi:MAG TPA: efflux RND transporter permease subunit, partial [Alphaproteobacteria bacterium]|nr:efflux RND transporter permease subunit [Alphaproteobacteria bacterium]